MPKLDLAGYTNSQKFCQNWQLIIMILLQIGKLPVLAVIGYKQHVYTNLYNKGLNEQFPGNNFKFEIKSQVIIKHHLPKLHGFLEIANRGV